MGVDARLRAAIAKRLRVTERQVQRLISNEVNLLGVSSRVAALQVARKRGVPIASYATEEDLAALRAATSPAPVQVAATLPPPAGPARRSARKGTAKRQQNNLVWVVHGRNLAARDGLYAFLLAIGLTPLEWNQALAKTRKAAPYVGEVLDSAFGRVGAVVVLMTPDDEARLREKYRQKGDPASETKLSLQARPNVLFEAGMAFGLHPERTVIVQLGNLRPFSNIGGRHIVQMNNRSEKRQELAERLQAAGAKVDLKGTHWHTAGNFDLDD